MMNWRVAMYKKFLLFVISFLMVVSSLVFAFDGIVCDNCNNQIDVCNASYDSVVCDSTDRFIDIRNFVLSYREKLENSSVLCNGIVMLFGTVFGSVYFGPVVGVLLMSVGAVSKRRANRPLKASNKDVTQRVGHTSSKQTNNDSNRPLKASNKDVNAEMKISKEADGTVTGDISTQYTKRFNKDNYFRVKCSALVARDRDRAGVYRVRNFMLQARLQHNF
jgi:hypothetical protein